MNFDQKADLYNAHASIQKDLIKWSFPYLFPHITGKHVLEMGSGTGLLSQALASLNPQKLYCTDISPQMLTVGCKAVPSASWLRLNAWEPSSYGLKVDTLVSSSLLQWCLDPLKVLNKWLQLLKPNGILVASFFIDKTLWELRSLSPLISNLPWFNQKHWENMLYQTKAQVLHSKDSIKTYYHPNALHILKQLHQIGSVTPRIFSPIKLRGIIKNYTQEFMSPQGVPCTWHYYTFTLKKTA